MIDLHSLPLESWSDEDLAGMAQERKAEIDRLSGEHDTILGELGRRFKDGIEAAFKAANKDHGKVRYVPSGQCFELDAEVRQTVEWDQDALRKAADGDGEGKPALTPEEAAHLIAVKLSVPEKKYGALPPGAAKDALTAARTTKLSKPTIKVNIVEE
jgi:hypothetical protein